MVIGLGTPIPNLANLPGPSRPGYPSGGGGTPFTNTYSMAFDGVDDYVDVGVSSGTNDVSISCWMKSTEVVVYNDSRMPFGGRPSSGGSNYSLGRIRSQFATPTELNVSLFNTFGSTVLNDGDWHNLVYTYNHTTKEVKAYVDGNTTPEATVTFPAWISNYQFRIGDDPVSSWFFEGNVDECAVWYSVLGTSDVTTIYNSGTPNNLDDLSTPPTAWWRMGDNGSWKSPQWLIPQNSNKDKVSNYSFDFDGVDDYVDVFNSVTVPTAFQSIGDNNSYSISGWIKTTAGGAVPGGAWISNITIFELRNEYPAGQHVPFSLGVSQNKISFGRTDDYTTGADLVLSTSTVNNGNWRHIGIVIVDDAYTFYLDGQPDGSGTFSASAGDCSVGTIASNMQIGIRARDGGQKDSNPFSGQISDLALWNSELSSSNMETIYNSGTPTTLPVTPLAYYKMGEDATFSTNWTVPDSVGSADGTSANMTIEDRVGNAPNSINNALSYNMDEVDREADTPPTP